MRRLKILAVAGLILAVTATAGATGVYNIQVFLEGPYNAGGSMNVGMADDPDHGIPTVSPYDGSDIGSLPGGNIVDWLWVELWSGLAGPCAEATNAFLMTDGSVVGTDGGNLAFSSPDGDYWLVVRHRNHLDIESAAAHTLGATPTDVDLTGLGSIYGNGYKELESGVSGMIAGDGDNDGKVEYVDTWKVITWDGVDYYFPDEYGDDYDLWASTVGMAGYLPADYDLNGQVQNSDKNGLLTPNDGLESSVVPEPLTMLAVGMGIAGLAGYIRKRRLA